MEQKGSLPPIIEDESDDNLVPLLYQKELSKREQKDSGYASGQVNGYHNTLTNQSNSLPHGSEVIDDTHLPYNSWRSKFCLKKTDSQMVGMDMQSKLGQSLDLQQNVNSLQSRTMPHANSLPHAQRQEAVDYRQLDSAFNDQAGVRGPVEQERYYPREAHAFSSSYNETPKGYFSDYNKKAYQDNFGNPDSRFRNLNQTMPDRLEYHTPERAPSHSTPFMPFGKSSHSFSPHHIPSNPYNPGNLNGVADVSPSCQNICCNNPQPHRIHQGMSNVLSPFRNPEYHQSKQLVKLSPEQQSCNCHIKSEIRNKKWEKIDKVRKKQISDLYRIVWLQNEQIIQIQNEMKKLIQINNERTDEKSKRSHDSAEHASKISHKGTSEKRMFNLSVIEENKNLMEKVSVGIMTSFIDTTTVKKKGKVKDVKNKTRQAKRSSSSSSVSCESSSNSSESEGSSEQYKKEAIKNFRKKPVKPYEDSLALSCIEIPPFAPDTPSPRSSPVQIELQDFDSSSKSDESDTTESEEDTTPPVGWTFYDRVVGKVNNMLNKSESECDSEADVQRKTIEQLRKLGINMDQESPSSKRVTFNAPFHQKAQLLPESDTSMKMNALAVKYFKEDRVSPEEPNEQYQNNVANNTNLSYATLRYLERYHLPKLVAEPPEKVEKKTKKKNEKFKKEEHHELRKSHKKKSKSGQHSGKILDITAIKQQPKLLPKKQ